MAPALPAVRALSFLTYGDEVQVCDERFGRPKLRIVRKAHFDPVRLTLGVECGIHVHLGAVTVHSIAVARIWRCFKCFQRESVMRRRRVF